MPLFEKPPLESLPRASDRWTPIYLEHGRVEVDDASVKWISSDGLVVRIPVATLSSLILGPGTTVTHAAVKTCADSNTPVFWMGEEGLRFYAYGITPNHANTMARKHAKLWSSAKTRSSIALQMFRFRFSEEEISNATLDQLRGMEGKRVKVEYAKLGVKFGVTWKGRNYSQDRWEPADCINQALSSANACLYAITSAVVCAMGFIPQLGFVHDGGTLPFIYDIADLYKHETSWPAAFRAVSLDPKNIGDVTRDFLKENIESSRLLQRMPQDLERLFKGF